ncbi:MAG: hypothetical protein NWF14_01995 [Candidatus Bathyarchaeota archaeon]|nr:hypothetical protein [Candidatus Bathyarchaeota archaeon]
MRPKIAVTTVSGRAYYRLVNELKQRMISFLSLIPGESIPSSVEVVITTAEEKPSVDHPTVLVYDAGADPSGTIDEALRIIQSKEAYGELAIGVDPGKTFGIAVLGDGKVLRKEERLPLEMAVDNILSEMKKNPAKVRKVKIGNGIPELAEEIASRLSPALPDDVAIEMVSEEGTSSLRGKGFRKKMSDADSAIKIAKKMGEVLPRRKDM